MKLLTATLESRTCIVLTFDQQAIHLKKGAISLTPKTTITSVTSLAHVVQIDVEGLRLSKNYTVFVKGVGNLPVVLGSVLDEFKSEKPLGCTIENNRLVFRVFSPRASNVVLQLARSVNDTVGTRYEMTMDADGVWEAVLEAGVSEPYYQYRISGPVGTAEGFNDAVAVADPYARAVVARNTYKQEAFTIIPGKEQSFDWGNDDFIPVDPRDAVIYETHVRDMTIHPSSGIGDDLAGTYAGLVSPNGIGGINHIKSLGINTVELLPLQHFARIEPPYKQHTPEGYYNIWNPYEYNHWGYMTSYFFAPDPSAATGAIRGKGEWNELGTRHITEFKSMVKALHEAGLSVVMDVVYNHTSQYDYQPLKFADRQYYYHLDEHGAFRSASGCGNDFNSSRPMGKRLIIDSILYWMNEFHIDGFRFDLASLIDRDTFVELRKEARKVNPHVMLIAEPWGGGHHDLDRFSEIEFSAWNDNFRNSIKGENPHRDRGYIFGTWGWNSPEAFGKWVIGSTEEMGGPFKTPGHSVNYVESHDGYTLGDFVRIGSGEWHAHEPVRDMEGHVALSSRQMQLHKMAALLLFTCQGAVMLHSGQEFARSKVVAKRNIPDIESGVLDENSYEKDDETNWINWDHAGINSELTQYYRGMIAIRKKYKAFRRAPLSAYEFLIPDVHLASGYVLRQKGSPMLVFLINPNESANATYTIPDGLWRVLADADKADPGGKRTVKGGTIILASGTGMVLVEET